jgi:hypothetical protein
MWESIAPRSAAKRRKQTHLPRERVSSLQATGPLPGIDKGCEAAEKMLLTWLPRAGRDRKVQQRGNNRFPCFWRAGAAGMRWLSISCTWNKVAQGGFRLCRNSASLRRSMASYDGLGFASCTSAYGSRSVMMLARLALALRPPLPVREMAINQPGMGPRTAH